MSSPVAPIEDRRLRGIGLVILGYLCFTLIDTCSKWLQMSGMPTTQVVLVRYVGQLILVSALFLPRQGTALLQTRKPALELVRGLALMASTLLNFSALLYLPLTVTGSISFTAPLILCALSGPLLGEHVGWRRWVAILVGFAGVLIIVRPGTDSFHPAALLVIGGAACNAMYLILTRRLAGVDSVSTQQFYAALVATLCVAPFGIPGWVWPTGIGWVPFVLIGVVALAGHQLVTLAHRYAPASVLAPFGYSQIVFMTLASVVVFGQLPDVWMMLGAPVVIGSGFYLWLRERQLAKSVITEVTVRD